MIWQIKAVAKPRMTRSDRWRKRPIVQKYWDYKEELNYLARMDGYELGPVLSVKFFIAMPKSWSIKKKKKMIRLPHQQTPDLDNYLKGFMDAFVDDDSFVYEFVNCGKYWSIDKDYIVIDENERGSMDDFSSESEEVSSWGEEDKGKVS